MLQWWRSRVASALQQEWAHLQDNATLWACRDFRDKSCLIGPEFSKSRWESTLRLRWGVRWRSQEQCKVQSRKNWEWIWANLKAWLRSQAWQKWLTSPPIHSIKHLPWIRQWYRKSIVVKWHCRHRHLKVLQESGGWSRPKLHHSQVLGAHAEKAKKKGDGWNA